ncbi:C4-dicarboxylate TRAP transporter substrate-binding protein [Marinobacterium aestuariivivens]|uniref:C4-dicarboxylate TRAP transporter substrate-binding protein n=1 Tax=Marinobacterium aestuariivivens TaxID=1698799 RepID=A0ABW2A5G3_9GAMM
MWHKYVMSACIASCLTLVQATAAHAGETFRLTVGASHPQVLPWVGVISNHFIPEVTRRVEALGKGYNIQWQEAYGGQLYKANATLSSVADGIVDIGWVFSNLEGAKQPLSQVTIYTPAVTDDPALMMEVFNELNETVPALKAEWEQNNLVFLGACSGDTYHMFTTFPLNSVEDLDGRRISAPGVLASWMRGTGSVAVNGALTTYYTDLQTGLSEGALSLTSGVMGIKLHEVAPYVTKVNLGSTYFGALAINKDTWGRLPEDVRQIMKEVGREYSRKLGEAVMANYHNGMKTLAEEGARATPPVQILDWSREQRLAWINAMPNIAAEWVKENEAKGLPAREVLSAYMNAMREQGVEPLRNWDREL